VGAPNGLVSDKSEARKEVDIPAPRRPHIPPGGIVTSADWKPDPLGKLGINSTDTRGLSLGGALAGAKGKSKTTGPRGRLGNANIPSL